MLTIETGEVVVGSLQPNQPGVIQVGEVVVDEVVAGEVVAGEVVAGEVLVAGREMVLLVGVVVTSSLHPNHPGVLHVEVDVVVVEVVVCVDPELVVVSSRHPHHPGVWQVDVRVCDLVVVVVVGGEVLVLLPVTSFHNGQS